MLRHLPLCSPRPGSLLRRTMRLPRFFAVSYQTLFEFECRAVPHGFHHCLLCRASCFLPSKWPPLSALPCLMVSSAIYWLVPHAPHRCTSPFPLRCFHRFLLCSLAHFFIRCQLCRTSWFPPVSAVLYHIVSTPSVPGPSAGS